MRFRLTVVTAPGTLKLRNEIRLLKSALIYGDEVSLISPNAVFLSSIAGLIDPTEDELIEFLVNTAPLISDIDEETSALAFEIYRQLQAKRNRTRLEIIQMQRLKAALAKAARDLRERLLPKFEESGFEELVRPIDQGLLKFHDLGASLAEAQDASVNDLVAEYVGVIVNAFRSGKEYLLLDDQTGTLVRGLIAAGRLEEKRSTVSKGKQASSAHSLFERMPAFPEATIDELLDLRADLSQYLIHFRSAIVQVASDIHAAQFDPDFDRQLDDIWIRRVLPELNEVRERIAESGFKNRFIGQITRPVNLVPASGPAVVVGLMSKAASVDWLTAVIETGLLTAGHLATSASNALRETRSRQRELQRSGFYLLNELSDRLVAA